MQESQGPNVDTPRPRLADVAGEQLVSTLTEIEAANELQLQWLRTRVRRLRQRTPPPSNPLALPGIDITMRPRRAA